MTDHCCSMHHHHHHHHQLPLQQLPLMEEATPMSSPRRSSMDRELDDDDATRHQQTSSSRRRRRRHRSSSSSSSSSSRIVLLAALCLATAAALTSCDAFSSSSPTIRRSALRSNTCSRRRSYYMGGSSVAEPPTMPSSSSSAAASSARRSGASSTDFQKRMRGLVSGRRRGNIIKNNKPLNLVTANTLEEYKEALLSAKDDDKLVVVRFYATWCKACRAIQPSYHRMASLYPQITFLEVSVTDKNANLHQGLGVPSLPYGHVYHPDAGLVEELKISKRHFRTLVERVRWYDRGYCKLDEHSGEDEVEVEGKE